MENKLKIGDEVWITDLRGLRDNETWSSVLSQSEGAKPLCPESESSCGGEGAEKGAVIQDIIAIASQALAAEAARVSTLGEW